MNVPPINIKMPDTMGVGPIDTGAPAVPTGNNDKELHDASRDFVAVLYSNMFQNMREAGQDEDNESGMFSSFETSMFMGFFDEEMGKKFADEGGKSLADTLFHQLNHNHGSTPVASTATAAPPPPIPAGVGNAEFPQIVPTPPSSVNEPVINLNGSSLPANANVAPVVPPPTTPVVNVNTSPSGPPPVPVLPPPLTGNAGQPAVNGPAQVVPPPPLPPQMPGLSHH